MIGAMQQQLDFIAYIQRMLVEGEFSATYKLALLHAIADIGSAKRAIPLLQSKATLSYRVIHTGSTNSLLPIIGIKHAISSSNSRREPYLSKIAGAKSKVITEIV